MCLPCWDDALSTSVLSKHDRFSADAAPPMARGACGGDATVEDAEGQGQSRSVIQGLPAPIVHLCWAACRVAGHHTCRQENPPRRNPPARQLRSGSSSQFPSAAPHDRIAALGAHLVL
jgi:hypothetical protein